MPIDPKEKPEQVDTPNETSTEWESPRTPLKTEVESKEAAAEEVEPSPVEGEPEPESSTKPESESGKVGRLQRFRRWYVTHKKISIPATTFLILALILSIPTSRYVVAGLFINHDIQVHVIDSETGAPVSDAFVSASSGQPGTTDGTGTAVLTNVSPGQTTVTVTKKHYNDGSASITVSVVNPKEPYEISMKASGRAANIKVTDKINGEALPDVDIAVADIKAKTDEAGEALVVLPPDTASFDATLNKEGYNESKVAIKVSDTAIEQNDLAMTPSGQVYFLSNRSGSIDVMKANLDGSDAKVVLAGTGNEDEDNTVLIASADWKYLALLARREGKYPKVYVITTSDDKLTVADEGNATFTLSGWLGSKLVYTLKRTDVKPWQTGAQKLKSYDASSGKIATLNQTTGEGNVNSNLFEYYQFVYLHGDTVVYGKGWTTESYEEPVDYSGRQETLSAISPDGQNYKEVAGYDTATKSVGYAPHAPNKIYIQVSTLSDGESQEDYTYYEYVIGSTPSEISLSIDQFNRSYPYYYPSADAQKMAWEEYRDGKNEILIGNSVGENGQSIGELQDQYLFGWFGPKYILVTKNGSELFAISSAKIGEPVKVSNYFNSFGYSSTYYALSQQWYQY